MRFKPLVLKMHCAIVAVTGGITGYLLWWGNNTINAGISGTVATVYGIGLGMLVCVAIDDWRAKRHHLAQVKQRKLASEQAVS